MPTTPVSLSDDQLVAIIRAATPLLPPDRVPFFEAVAHELARLPEVGDGSLHRVIAEVQRRHFSPPKDSGYHGGSKYAGGKRAR
jgi:hypothetical protein